MDRNRRELRLPIFLTQGFLLLLAATAHAQCDPDVTWEIHQPTGDVAEILIDGSRAWIGADGGVIRIELGEISGGDPEQIKITDTEGLVSTEITALARDSFGNIWVGTREDGVSIVDPNGNHIANLSSFDELYGDRVVAIGGRGNRMAVVSVDSFSPSGALEGGGFVIITVAQDGDGNFSFTPSGVAPGLDVGQDVLFTDDAIWFATSGKGVWLRDESVVPAAYGQALREDDGLLSANVKKILEAPHFDLSGRQVLWLGTGAGLQTYDPATDALDTVPGFGTQSILDLFYDGTTMNVLADTGTSRDLFTMDLTSVFVAVRVPRVDCFSDTLYIPREIASDGAGHIVLGTRREGFSVREGFAWFCPPPLGPHAPQVADLHLSSDGILYFGTGDKRRLNTRWNGLGVYDGIEWTAITREQNILHGNMTEVHVWGDGSVWFGSTVSAATGGLNRYFPETGALENYHNETVNTSNRTLGRQVRSLMEDPAGNLWVLYGQNPRGGLSVIEAPPSLRIKNYDFGQIFVGGTLLRGFDMDSQGRLWISTHDEPDPARLYVVDPRGTLFDLTDDKVASFSMANEIVDLGETVDVIIDSKDRIWIAGVKGLALGQINPGELSATWQEIIPNAAQAGGRNPLPYTTLELDWNDNLWVGTESAGLVRISNDLSTWTWYDESEGCPLPDPSVSGIHAVDETRVIYVGTATGGIARLDVSGVSTDEDHNSAEPYPNPWDPQADGSITFGGIPTSVTVDLRIFTVNGEIVNEQLGVRGTKTWTGENLGGFIVESGVYVVRARDVASGEIYESMVAVLR